MEKYNAFFEWGIFPDRLKTATLRSLYKKWDKKISTTI